MSVTRDPCEARLAHLVDVEGQLSAVAECDVLGLQRRRPGRAAAQQPPGPTQRRTLPNTHTHTHRQGRITQDAPTDNDKLLPRKSAAFHEPFNMFLYSVFNLGERRCWQFIVVIYIGTDNHRPVSVTMVTMYHGNQRQSPLDFRDISVTR